MVYVDIEQIIISKTEIGDEMFNFDNINNNIGFLVSK